MKASRAHHRWLAFVLLASVALLASVRAQGDGNAPPPGPLAWLDAPTETAAIADLQQVVAALAPSERAAFLRDVGEALSAGRPGTTTGQGRRLCVGILAAVAVAEAKVARNAQLAEWFLFHAARFLVAGNDCEGADEVLVRADETFGDASPYAFERRALRIDCLLHLDRLRDAQREGARADTAKLTPLQRARSLAQQGTIEVHLGRLERANRLLADARDRVDALLAAADASARGVLIATRSEILLRQLDLMTLRETAHDVQPTLDRYLATCAAEGVALTPPAIATFAVHRASGMYYGTQGDPVSVPAAITAIDAALSHQALAPHQRELMLLWRADLRLCSGDHAGAARDLQELGPAALRLRALRAVIAAALARATAADREVLLAFEVELRRALEEMLVTWRSVESDGEGTGFLRFGSRMRVIGELISLTASLHGPERALQHVLDVQCCTSLAMAHVRSTPSLAELRRTELRPGHGALVFLPAWNTSHAFAIDDRAVVHVPLPSASHLRAKARRLQVELIALEGAPAGAASVEDVRRASRQLAADLLATPLLRRLDAWHHVTITGAGLLHDLPFEALELEDGALLGERFAVTTSASLPLLARLAESAPDALAAPTCRLVATLCPSRAFAERNDVQAMTQLSGPSWQRLLDLVPPGSELLVDGAATPSAFAAACRAHAVDVTVVVAHGQRATGNESPTLGLADDPAHAGGLLTPAAIAALPQSGVVILDACHGARGTERVGDDDGAGSLAGAFLRGGAATVIASPASVLLNTSLSFTSELLGALAQGVDVAEAARRARLRVAGGDRLIAYRLAQIGVSGLGTRTVARPANPILRAALWMLAAALVTAVAWILRRSRLRVATASGSKAAAVPGST